MVELENLIFGEGKDGSKVKEKKFPHSMSDDDDI